MHLSAACGQGVSAAKSLGSRLARASVGTVLSVAVFLLGSASRRVLEQVATGLSVAIRAVGAVISVSSKPCANDDETLFQGHPL
jgi:hypothetical protein